MIKIPYDTTIADSVGRFAGDEVIGGNYKLVYTVKATALSNDTAQLDADGYPAGPCLFGDIDYTSEVVFAGPDQDSIQYIVIDYDTWLNQDKNYTLTIGQS